MIFIKHNQQIINQKNKNIKLFVYIFLVGSAMSQAFAQYEIRKQTVNSGGKPIISESYQIKGSIGQIDASNSLLSGSYRLNAGFWHENNDLILKNGFE